MYTVDVWMRVYEYITCVYVCVEERHYKTLKLYGFQLSGRYKSKKDILFGRHFFENKPAKYLEKILAPELIKLLQKDAF